MHTVLIIIGGTTLTTAIGYLFSQREEVGTGFNSYASCFMEDEDFPLFELKGKLYSLRDLPPDLHQEYLRGKVEDFHRMTELANEFAVRLAVSNSDQALSPGEVLEKEQPSESDIDLYLEANPPSASISTETLRKSVRDHLEKQRMLSFVSEKMSSLKQDRSFKNTLPIPCGPEVTTNVEAVSRVLGETKGPISVRAYIDLFSSQSRFLSEHLVKLAKNASDKVTIREIYVPQLRGGLSEAFARGAYCASAQGKNAVNSFRLSATKVSGSELEQIHSPGTFSGYPIIDDILNKISSINKAAFDQCLNSSDSAKYIDEAISAAHRDGISSPPAIFLNRRRILFFASRSPSEVLEELSISILRR